MPIDLSNVNVSLARTGVDTLGLDNWRKLVEDLLDLGFGLMHDAGYLPV